MKSVYIILILGCLFGTCFAQNNSYRAWVNLGLSVMAKIYTGLPKQYYTNLNLGYNFKFL